VHQAYAATATVDCSQTAVQAALDAGEVATGQVLSSQGNLTFAAIAKDGDYGQPQNIPSDVFSLAVFNSSNVAIKQITAAPLGGGNLVVHNR
jgi:hypothetical protein